MLRGAVGSGQHYARQTLNRLIIRAALPGDCEAVEKKYAGLSEDSTLFSGIKVWHRGLAIVEGISRTGEREVQVEIESMGVNHIYVVSAPSTPSLCSN